MATRIFLKLGDIKGSSTDKSHKEWIDIDSFGGYAGQVPWFEWKLLGVKPMLASMHGRRLPPEPCKGDGGMTFCEPWEMRPAMYIVEGKPLLPNYAFSKRVIYVDKETNLIPTSDLYDANGELWKNVQISFRADHKPNPARLQQHLRDGLGQDDAAVARWIRHWIAEGFGALETLIERNYRDGGHCLGRWVTLADA
mgnify:CR=1 FL=1